MPHLCIKPQCPNDCSGCNHAIDQADTARVLVFELLKAWTEDGLKGMVLEDGESALCDRARAFLAAPQPEPATEPARPFGTLLCQHGACYPGETHANRCRVWTPDQVRAAGGKYLDTLAIGF
jgi:hypothetical protein